MRKKTSNTQGWMGGEGSEQHHSERPCRTISDQGSDSHLTFLLISPLCFFFFLAAQAQRAVSLSARVTIPRSGATSPGHLRRARENSSENGPSSSPAWLSLLHPSVLPGSPGLTKAAAASGTLGEPVPSSPARPQGVGAAHGPRRAGRHGAVGAAGGLATETHDP